MTRKAPAKSKRPAKGDIELKVEPDILERDKLDCLTRSAKNLIEKIRRHSGAADVSKDSAEPDGGWNIRETVWPTYAIDGIPSPIGLRLMPLSRLSAALGLGGSEVMIGYFVDRRAARHVFPSRPMVVKISGAKKLRDEHDNALAVRDYVAFEMSSFAVPVHYDEIGEYQLLWSPFSSNRWVLEALQDSGNDYLELGVYDFLDLLRGKALPPYIRKLYANEADYSKSLLESIFRLLMPLHRRGGLAAVRKRKIVREYSWYLRELEETWIEQLVRTWGDRNQTTIFDFERKWINPLWVLGRLKGLPHVPLFCGAVHGDLHPRNIVLSENLDPHIIDFGWSRDDAHIAKDFVLMEFNLRSVVLRPNISFRAVEQMAQWIEFDSHCPRTKHQYLDERLELIQALRNIAGRHFPADTDWDNEYVVPLFLVSLGLLKYIRESDNQISARLTVLYLAKYIKEKVLSKA